MYWFDLCYYVFIDLSVLFVHLCDLSDCYLYIIPDLSVLFVFIDLSVLFVLNIQNFKTVLFVHLIRFIWCLFLYVMLPFICVICNLLIYLCYLTFPPPLRSSKNQVLFVNLSGFISVICILIHDLSLINLQANWFICSYLYLLIYLCYLYLLWFTPPVLFVFTLYLSVLFILN